jgi:hypothetical protein
MGKPWIRGDLPWKQLRAKVPVGSVFGRRIASYRRMIRPANFIYLELAVNANSLH